MTDPPKPSIEDRLAALEAAVEAIRQSLRMLGVSADRSQPSSQSGRMAARVERAGPARAETPPAPTIRDPYQPLRRTPGLFSTLLDRGPQFWISRAGIVLLLVGVAYLFKYAVDQGWLTPWIRVTFGVVLGGTLATIGFRVQRQEHWFSQVMLGGAAATWYITGFAAFQLLHLVSYPAAFVFMVLVTGFTFFASLQQDEPALAVLAAMGGFATPFFLYTDAGSVPGLMAYTCIILLGTSTIYFVKGWRSLLWITVLDAWLVLGLGFETDAPADRMALQGAVVTFWLLFWLVPLVRIERNALTARKNHDIVALLLATPVIALFVSRAIWTVEDTLWGGTALALGVAYSLATRYLGRRRELALFAAAHGVTAAALVAIGIALLFEQDVVIVLLAVEAAGLHLLSQRLTARGLSAPDDAILDFDVAAHLLFAIIGLWLWQRLVEGGLPDTAVLNAAAAANAAVIAMSVVASFWVETGATRWYRLGAHVSILLWLLRELGSLPAGDGIVTAAWGVYGLGILFSMRSARNVGLATLLLAAGKLVVHDLSQVEPIWRILLFLSFGGVFLAISYYFTDLWSGSEERKRTSQR